MSTSHAVVATEHASRYLQQLCKHWAHKFEAECTPSRGRIALPLGPAIIDAVDGAMRIEVSAANDADLATMREVVQSHLERFAFRETLAFEWSSEGRPEGP